MIRVLIVDDEILARVGIQSLLENSQEIQVVGSFNLASEALEFLKTTIVDIIITDIEIWCKILSRIKYFYTPLRIQIRKTKYRKYQIIRRFT